MKKVVIIGASSGIGRELAKVYSNKGYEVGLGDFRPQLLDELQKELPNKCHIKGMDVAKPAEARQALAELVEEMGGMDIIILNAGKGDPNATWEVELEIIAVNIAGFSVLATWANEYFEANGGGHIAGVSSVASKRGRRISTAYSASKAYISNYLEGLRQRSYHKRSGITVTEICPGFVATPMTQDNNNLFWVASAEKAAHQIYHAIRGKKQVAYITKRWWLVAKVVKHLPDFVWLRT